MQHSIEAVSRASLFTAVSDSFKVGLIASRADSSYRKFVRVRLAARRGQPGKGTTPKERREELTLGAKELLLKCQLAIGSMSPPVDCRDPQRQAQTRRAPRQLDDL